MSRRWLLGVAVLALVAAAAVVGWRVWLRDPGQFAPPVTARELGQVDHYQEGSLTLLGGGSQSQAHRLWDHYSHRRPFHGVTPRLLGISRVRLSGTASDGIYWLVLSDHVYQHSFGPGGGGGWSREAVFVPDGSKSVSGNAMTF